MPMPSFLHENQKIATNLKRLRVLHNLSLSQVSRDTGIPKGSLSSYEREGTISQERLRKLSDYYEVPFEFMTMTWQKLESRVPRSYLS